MGTPYSISQFSTGFTTPFLSTKPEPVTFTSVQSSTKKEIDDQTTISGCIKRKRIQETELAISFFLALYLMIRTSIFVRNMYLD